MFSGRLQRPLNQELLTRAIQRFEEVGLSTVDELFSRSDWAKVAENCLDGDQSLKREFVRMLCEMKVFLLPLSPL